MAAPKTRFKPSSGIRRYTPEDYDMIHLWSRDRGTNPPTEESLSDLGFIVDGRVAGWLYITNSNIAIIDGVLSNPHTVPSMRRQSLQKLCSTLVDTAHLLGFTNIIAVTKHPSIKSICTKMGFETDDQFRIYALREKE